MNLAPSWGLVKAYKEGKCSEDEYTIRYLLELEDRKLTPERVAADLADGSILLCYEKTGDFCHRHIAAEWLERGADVIVTEIVDPPTPHIVDELLTF